MIMDLATNGERGIPRDRLWSVEEVSYYLGVPLGTLYSWGVQRRRPACRRICRFLRYRPEDVTAWFAGLGDWQRQGEWSAAGYRRARRCPLPREAERSRGSVGVLPERAGVRKRIEAHGRFARISMTQDVYMGRRAVDQAAAAVLDGISPPGHDCDDQPPAVLSAVLSVVV